MISKLLIDIEKSFCEKRIQEITDSERQYIEFKTNEFLADLASMSSVSNGYFIEFKPIDNEQYSLFISVDFAPDSEIIFKQVAQSEIVNRIKYFRFFHSGGQANGTVELIFKELLSYQSFENLLFFYVKPSSESGCVIATFDGSYEESGLGGKILDKMPSLRVLNLVSAPNDSFFQRKFHPLTTLEVRAGYENNNFLSNLSKSTCFEKLKHLSYQEINIALTNSDENVTMPFEDVKQFMESTSLPELDVLSLFDLNISDEQVGVLINTYLGKKVKSLVITTQKAVISDWESYAKDRDVFINMFYIL